MKSRRLVLAAALLAAATAQGSPVFLDQQHAPEGNFGSLAVGSDRTQAQIISVGITGLLTRVDVKVGRSPETTEDLLLGIWSTDAEGLPDEQLATASIPASAVVIAGSRPFLSFDLRTARVFVAAGQRLAITLDSAAANTEPFQERWEWEQGGFYSRGMTLTLLDDGNRIGHAEDLHFRTFVEASTAIDIDIRPHNDRNQLNPRSGGKLQVAVVTTSVFDATSIDVSSIRFGARGNEAAPLRADIVDINRDGLDDLLLRFAIEQTGIECGAELASLSGRTGGDELVFDVDGVATVGCP